MDALSICSIGWGLNLIAIAVISKLGEDDEPNMGRFTVISLLCSCVPFIYIAFTAVVGLIFVFEEYPKQVNTVLSYVVPVLGFTAGIVLLLHGLFL